MIAGIIVAGLIFIGGCIGIIAESLVNRRLTKKYNKYNDKFADIFHLSANTYKEKRGKKNIFFYPIMLLLLWVVSGTATAVTIFAMKWKLHFLVDTALVILSFPLLFMVFVGIAFICIELRTVLGVINQKKNLRKISEIRKKYLNED